MTAVASSRRDEPQSPALVRPALQADSLYRFFHAGDEETLALQGLSLQVASGELVAVTGPSGSGKSTLLACLAGIDEPDGGTVWVSGERMSHQSEPSRARMRARHIGVLFQSGNLLSHLTVVQNIRLAHLLAGRPPNTRTPIAVLLERLHIEERAHAYPAQLSGGEAARAGLAVALANDPAVVLSDEPTGELDATAEQAVLELLRDGADRGSAILVASHSPAVAQAADRTITLCDGKVSL